MVRKFLAFIYCGIGILLPYKLRILYVEGLGWVTQFFYLTYIGIFKIIISELEKAKLEKDAEIKK